MDSTDKREERIEELLVGKLPPDANLIQIKEKASELQGKSREVSKSLIKNRDILSGLQRKLNPVERFFSEQVMKDNLAKASRERLDKDARERRIKYLIDNSEEQDTKGIFDEMEEVQHNVSTLEVIMKNNKIIADQLNNILNAEINRSRQQNDMEKLRRAT